jgi:hypothetical protein
LSASLGVNGKSTNGVIDRGVNVARKELLSQTVAGMENTARNGTQGIAAEMEETKDSPQQRAGQRCSLLKYGEGFHTPTEWK